jgi:hypothetical protein
VRLIAYGDAVELDKHMPGELVLNGQHLMFEQHRAALDGGFAFVLHHLYFDGSHVALCHKNMTKMMQTIHHPMWSIISIVMFFSLIVGEIA